MFLAVLMFLCMFFKNVFYKDVKNMFFMFFYLQINVFNNYGINSVLTESALPSVLKVANLEFCSAVCI